MGQGTLRALNHRNPPGSGPNERVVSIPKSCSSLLQTSAHRDPRAALRAALTLSLWLTHLAPHAPHLPPMSERERGVTFGRMFCV